MHLAVDILFIEAPSRIPVLPFEGKCATVEGKSPPFWAGDRSREMLNRTQAAQAVIHLRVNRASVWWPRAIVDRSFAKEGTP
jgi:hypothetical protein